MWREGGLRKKLNNKILLCDYVNSVFLFLSVSNIFFYSHLLQQKTTVSEGSFWKNIQITQLMTSPSGQAKNRVQSVSSMMTVVLPTGTLNQIQIRMQRCGSRKVPQKKKSCYKDSLRAEACQFRHF